MPTPSSSEGGGIPQGGPLTSNLDADGKTLIDVAQLNQLAQNLTIRLAAAGATDLSITDAGGPTDLLHISDGGWSLKSLAGNQWLGVSAFNLDFAIPDAAGRITLDDFAGNDVIKIQNASKLGFYGASPATRPAAIANAAGGAVIDAEARVALNASLAALRTLGLIAT